MNPLMQEKCRLSFGQCLAKIISDVFSPLLVPTYGMALSMWVTSLRALPERSRLLATLLIAMITGLVPLAFIMTMRRMGKISNNDISDRTQRPLPLTVAILCYVAGAIFLGYAHAPLWLQIFFYGAAAAAAIALLITFWWKISAHSTAMGGLLGLLFWFAVGGLADINAMVLITVGIVISGAIGTSRIALRCHTLSQVCAGFALGFVCTFLPTIIFYL